jgi:outer membrane protein assembly factor BamB
MGECRRLRMLITVVVAAVVLGACDWAQLGFGPQRTSYNPYEPALTESSVQHMHVAWSAPCACDSRTALVAGSTVYVVEGDSSSVPYTAAVRAFDAATGAPRWSTPLGTVNGADVAAIANGLVYVLVRPATGSDRVVALDATVGTSRWSTTPTAPGTGPVALTVPVVDGEQAFVAATASDATQVWALDTAGHAVWSAVPGGRLFDPHDGLAADPGHTVYVPTYLIFTGVPNHALIVTGYDEATGKVRSAVQAALNLPPAKLSFSDGLLLGDASIAAIHGVGPGAFALRPDTGQVLWNVDILQLAVAPGVVITQDPRVGATTARDVATGTARWTATEFGSTAIAGGLVYFGSGDVRRLSDGALVATITAGPATPSGGHVFLTGNGRLTALMP